VYQFKTPHPTTVAAVSVDTARTISSGSIILVATLGGFVCNHPVKAEVVDCVYLVANGVCLLLTRRVFAALRRSGARDRSK
jgi:hypothetical protein